MGVNGHHSNLEVEEVLFVYWKEIWLRLNWKEKHILCWSGLWKWPEVKKKKNIYIYICWSVGRLVNGRHKKKN